MSLVAELQQKVEAQEMLILDAKKQNDLLKSENDKLWERVYELEELTDHRHYIPQEWYAALQSENAKLRALVRDMWHELDAATQYDAGGVRGIVSEFADSMRDLGIEVE